MKKKIAKYAYLLLSSILLISCVSLPEEKPEQFLNASTEQLIDPYQFINEQMADSVKSHADLGPHVDLTEEEMSNSRERVRINEEQPINYVAMSQKEGVEYFPISLNFDNVGIKDAMRMMMEVTGTNIILGENVEGSITAHIQDVPWNTALESLLKIKGLAHHTDANITRIHTQENLLEQEAFDRKRLEDLQKSIKAQRAIQPMYTELFKLYYTDANTISTQVSSVLNGSSGSTADGSSEGAATSGPGITVDERTNSLIVKATRNELDLIARLIKEVDIRTPQILIEAFIVEVSDDFQKELGSRLGYNQADLFKNGSDTFQLSGTRFGRGGAPSWAADTESYGAMLGDVAQNLVGSAATGGLGGLLSTSAMTLKIELDAMQTDGFTKILSNPRIFTINNQKATISQGYQIPYLVPSQNGQASTYEMRDASLQLEVTPSIVGDGNVRLSINLEKSDVDLTIAVPPIATQTIVTTLMVKDASIVVIGGVKKQKTSDANDGVPFFNDIPIIGRAFRHEKKNDRFEELLIFIAPRVI
mgnify:CR=1 FL=1